MLKYNEVQKHIKTNFEFFKNEVVNELISYYGEQYRDIIVSRVEDTNFIFYINPKFNEFLMFDCKKKDNYKKLKKDYSKIQKEIKKNNLGKGEIYNSNSSNSDIVSRIIKDNIICFSYMYSNGDKELKREIFIPVYYGADDAIIHEMIHTVMSSPLFLNSTKNGDVLKYKFGIGLGDNVAESLMEECMTEIDARIIEKSIKKKNISFIDKYYLFEKRKCFYDNFIPSISKLYELYKEEINEARITLNSRKFIQSIGKENYCEFLSILNNFYTYFYDCEKSYYISHIKEYIKKIEKEKNRLVLSKN